MTTDSTVLTPAQAAQTSQAEVLPESSSPKVGFAVKRPVLWVPTLYFAEGLPQYLVSVFALYLFQALGVSNPQITAALGTIGFVWAVKPLWSPFLEAVPSQKLVVVITQIVGGVAIGGLALCLNTSSFFALSVAVLTVIAITSATHDIAADGLYIASLSKRLQTVYSGWRNCAYNVAKVALTGGLLKMIAYWQRDGLAGTSAWQAGLFVVALTMFALGFYHLWSLPKAPSASHENVGQTLIDVIKTFFQKPGIWMAIAFILLFRLAEGQITTIGPLFLTAARATGGLGLPLDDQGTIYGVYGTITFLVGGVLGAYFASWIGLKRSLIILILAMNLPNATYCYLSAALPADLLAIKAAVCVEMFGYGFGFTALMLYMMLVVAPGKYPTAHYALATGFMALGYNLAKFISGFIQDALGYQNFFIWVLLCTVPIVLFAMFLPIRVTADKQILSLEDAAQ